MRKRIADFPLDFGSIVGLALVGTVGLDPDFVPMLNLDEYFTDYFPAVEGGLWRIYQTLYVREQTYLSSSVLLKEFLTDPGRAGEHAIDGPKYALVARFLLDSFISPLLADRR